MSAIAMPYIAALVATVAGCGLGVLALFVLPRTLLTRAQSDSTADLEERLSHLIAQLRDLEEQRGRLDVSDYTAQKNEFEARAAKVLRAIQQPQARREKQIARDEAEATPAVAWLAARPQLRGALWGGGTVFVLALLYVLVMQEEHPNAPMAGNAGRPPMAAASGPGGAPGADPSAELRAVTQHLQENPDDVAALLRASHILLRSQMLEEAAVLNDRALALSPQDLEALTHKAVLTAAQNDGASAFKQLDDVLKRDGTFAEAWFFRGMLAMQQGNQELMRESITQYVRYAPDGPQKERMRAMLASVGGGAGN